MDKIMEALKKHFGYSSLRTGQDEAISAALRGHDCLVVMATGSGKSLCYQLPALVWKRGVVVVISPLISLMHDQVSALAERGIAAARTGIREDEERVMRNECKLLYTTPETALGRWKPILGRLDKEVGIKLVAIDEAHCVSEWGHDFRPEYHNLAELRQMLPGVPFMALTATATPRVQDEILQNLCLQGPQRGTKALSVVTTFDRPNLHYSAFERSDDLLLHILKRHIERARDGVHEAAIVYCLSQNETENRALKLVEMGMKRGQVGVYHGGMSDVQRTQVHNDFLADRLSVICATTAFGMGIDKPDVRHVIHWGAPKTLESYYQQSGRAGRDGAESFCTLLFKGNDFAMSAFYEQGRKGEIISAEARKALHEGISQMKQYCHTTSCRRAMLLHHFGEYKWQDGCGKCDNCERRSSGSFSVLDVQDVARQFLQAVRACKDSFGLGKYVSFLRGNNLPEWCKSRPGYGQGKNNSVEYWKALGQQLLSLSPPFLEEVSVLGNGWGFAKQQTFTLLKITRAGEEFMQQTAPTPLKITVPKDMMVATKRDAHVEKRQRGTGAAPDQSDMRELSQLRYKSTSSKFNDQEESLYIMLRSVRDKQAKENGVPPTRVCDENLLSELTLNRPSSKDELEEVEGANAMFKERYGESFVNAIVSFCSMPHIDLELGGFQPAKRACTEGGRKLPGFIQRQDKNSFASPRSMPKNVLTSVQGESSPSDAENWGCWVNQSSGVPSSGFMYDLGQGGEYSQACQSSNVAAHRSANKAVNGQGETETEMNESTCQHSAGRHAETEIELISQEEFQLLEQAMAAADQSKAAEASPAAATYTGPNPSPDCGPSTSKVANLADTGRLQGNKMSRRQSSSASSQGSSSGSGRISLQDFLKMPDNLFASPEAGGSRRVKEEDEDQASISSSARKEFTSVPAYGDGECSRVSESKACTPSSAGRPMSRSYTTTEEKSSFEAGAGRPMSRSNTTVDARPSYGDGGGGTRTQTTSSSMNRSNPQNGMEGRTTSVGKFAVVNEYKAYAEKQSAAVKSEPKKISSLGNLFDELCSSTGHAKGTREGSTSGGSGGEAKEENCSNKSMPKKMSCSLGSLFDDLVAPESKQESASVVKTEYNGRNEDDASEGCEGGVKKGSWLNKVRGTVTEKKKFDLKTVPEELVESNMLAYIQKRNGASIESMQSHFGITSNEQQRNFDKVLSDLQVNGEVYMNNEGIIVPI